MRTVKLLKSPEFRRSTGKHAGNHLLGKIETLPTSQEIKFQSEKDTHGYWIFSESGRRIRFTQILYMGHTSLMMLDSGIRSHGSKKTAAYMHEGY